MKNVEKFHSSQFSCNKLAERWVQRMWKKKKTLFGLTHVWGSFLTWPYKQAVAMSQKGGKKEGSTQDI